jgi:RNA polymerase sigma-70 factor (ECF subfamily)
MTTSFHDTRWTLVARSRGRDTHASAALSELCEAYYAPVVAFLRREGREDDAARELAHDFFAKLLAGGAIEGAKPERGRFRSYLLGALKHFAADQRDKAIAAKRGGGLDHAEMEDEMADGVVTKPDAEFDRQWALTVLDQAMAKLEQQAAAKGKSAEFAVLRPFLTGEADAADYEQAGREAGMTANAFKVAVHRLRARFREALRREVAETQPADANVEEEMGYLMQVLRDA